jgi:hypothetical protein
MTCIGNTPLYYSKLRVMQTCNSDLGIEPEKATEVHVPVYERKK